MGRIGLVLRKESTEVVDAAMLSSRGKETELARDSERSCWCSCCFCFLFLGGMIDVFSKKVKVSVLK